MWAEDAADCVVAALERSAETTGRTYELAGPETLSYDAMVELVLRSVRRRRALLHVPMPLARRILRLADALAGPAAFATEDEAELLELSLVTRHGTTDAERLGVTPKPMAAVLGAG
jgi:NADH dehydrogenase